MCTYWLSPRGIKPDRNNNTKARQRWRRRRRGSANLALKNLRILFVLARIPLSDLVSLIFIMYPLLLLIIPCASLIPSSGWFSTYLEVDVIDNRSKWKIIFAKNEGQEQGELIFLFLENPWPRRLVIDYNKFNCNYIFAHFSPPSQHLPHFMSL